MHPTPVEIEIAINRRIRAFDEAEMAAGRDPITIYISRLIREGINDARAEKDAEERRKHNQAAA